MTFYFVFLYASHVDLHALDRIGASKGCYGIAKVVQEPLSLVEERPRRGDGANQATPPPIVLIGYSVCQS